MSDTADLDLEKKAVLIGEYLVRDLNEIGLGHVQVTLNVTPSENGPVVTVSHTGDSEDDTVVATLVNALLKEQEWPGF